MQLTGILIAITKQPKLSIHESFNLLFNIYRNVQVTSKKKVYSSSQGCHTATGTHMPHGITQCYLPPGRGDIPAFTSAEAGTQLSDPGGMQGWVDLQVCWQCVMSTCFSVISGVRQGGIGLYSLLFFFAFISVRPWLLLSTNRTNTGNIIRPHRTHAVHRRGGLLIQMWRDLCVSGRTLRVNGSQVCDEIHLQTGASCTETAGATDMRSGCRSMY